MQVFNFPKAASPEALGLPSASIARMVNRLEAMELSMHGLLVLRHGQIAAEGYWKPYHAARPHRMYSVSKSFASMAVGLMVDEGKIRLSDRVADYFPDKLPDGPLPDYVAEATVRDLLMMSTPHSANSYTHTDPDWLKTFFGKEPSHPPGTIFAYDTAATVVVTALVERLSGMTMLEYMRPRLLGPMGVSENITCIQTPEGYSWAGSGVLCTLRDMTKMAYVLLCGGTVNGKTLLSRDYVEQATTPQIDLPSYAMPGYGYQIWCMPGDGFAFYGMGCQHAFCFPKKGIIVSCTADAQLDAARARPVIIECLYRLLEEASEGALPEEPAAQQALAARMESLTLRAQAGAKNSPWMSRLNGVPFTLQSNPMGIESLCFHFEGEEGVLEYVHDGGPCKLRFGLGHNVADHFPEQVYREKIGTYTDRYYECMNSAAWVEPHKLCLLVQVTDDYVGSILMTFSWKGKGLGVHMTKAAEWFLDRYQGFAGGEAAAPFDPPETPKVPANKYLS